MCAVCKRRDCVLASFRGEAWLCPIHEEIARNIIPTPATVAELRALFPARVTAAPRARSRAA